MSADEGGDDGPGRREVARRLFAAEFDDADLQYSESDEERAPNYVVTPSGARVNRMFFVGVLTELEQVNESMLRARIVDPTGAFVAYAGQYQPDELAFLERVEPPTFLAVTGKARTFQPEDSDRVFTSVRPETITEVDAETRDRWVVDAARRTVERIEVLSDAIESGRSGDALRASLLEEGVDPSLASGIPLALEHYGTTSTYLAALRETAVDAARVVADEIEEVERLTVAPDAGGDVRAPDRTTGTAPAADGSAASTASTAAASDTPGADADEDADEDGGDATTTAADATTGGDAGAPSAGDQTATAPESDTTAEGAETAVDANAEPASVDAGSEGAGTVEREPEREAASDEIGDFDVGEFDGDGEGDASAEASTEADLADGDEEFDPDEEVLDADEREEIEAEFGTDFSTAGDVEAEPDATPDVEPDAGSAEPVDPESSSGDDEADEADGDDEADEQATEPAADDDEPEEAAADAEAEPEPETGDDDAEPADLETAVLETIESLDEGDGADRDAVAAQVAEDHGVSETEVDDAIEEAMMSGRCYEPADGRVKSI